MKKDINITVDLYKQLYNKIKNYEFCPESENDTSCFMEIEIGKFMFNVRATFEVNVVDESFSHAFGIEEQWRLEVGELDGIEDVQVWYYDEETDYEAKVTDLFDESRFWSCNVNA